MANEEMTQEEAVLFQQVYLPAFLQKCAEIGINIPDEGTLGAALKTTALIKDYIAKSAGNQIKSAAANLEKVLGVAPEATQESTEGIKSAAFKMAQDPKIRAAIAGACVK